MPLLRVIAILAAVSVTTCHFNCVRDKAMRFSYLASLSQSLAKGKDLALPPDPRCHNESGCICQGAVFVAAHHFAPLNLDVWSAVRPPLASCALIEPSEPARIVLDRHQIRHVPT